jgi:hypothetical protein
MFRASLLLDLSSCYVTRLLGVRFLSSDAGTLHQSFASLVLFSRHCFVSVYGTNGVYLVHACCLSSNASCSSTCSGISAASHIAALREFNLKLSNQRRETGRPMANIPLAPVTAHICLSQYMPVARSRFVLHAGLVPCDCWVQTWSSAATFLCKDLHA